MEVKFTGRILDNDTVPVFDYDPMVFVDVKLNLPTDVECKFVRQVGFRRYSQFKKYILSLVYCYANEINN